MTERDLFLRTLDYKDPSDRVNYLDTVCAGDPTLRQRMESLMKSWHMAANFLEVPVIEQLAARIRYHSSFQELTMNSESSVIGVYDNIDQADQAVQKLGQGGFPIQHVSVISQNLSSESKVHGFVTSCDVARSSARTGAWVGGIFGALVGAAFIWVPGVGPIIVAGSLAAALLGGVEGAVTGAATAGVFGWLASLGISKQHIVKHEETIRAGKCLVIAHGTPDEIKNAQAILGGTAPVELNAHVAA